jgi:hypothetical protein
MGWDFEFDVMIAVGSRFVKAWTPIVWTPTGLPAGLITSSIYSTVLTLPEVEEQVLAINAWYANLRS